jgi:taurine dioxygenase
MTLAIRPLSPVFGAEVLGIDLENGLTDALFQELIALWRRHLVLLIRDQETGDRKLLDFARRFGTLDPAPALDKARSSPDGFPEITVVSNVVENGQPIGGLGHGELAWHSDMTYVADPPVGCVLHAWEAPAGAGKTHFASLRAALEALSPEDRARIAALKSVHDDAYTSAGTRRHGVARQSEPRVHPLVIRHPSWGDEALLIGRQRGGAVIGLPQPESDALLARIWDVATRPENTIAHDWRPGDVVIWDNLHVLHRRDAFDGDARRILHRAQIRALHPALQSVPA